MNEEVKQNCIKLQLIQRLASKQCKPLLPHFVRLLLAWGNLSKLPTWSVDTRIQTCKWIFRCFLEFSSNVCWKFHYILKVHLTCEDQ